MSRVFIAIACAVGVSACSPDPQPAGDVTTPPTVQSPTPEPAAAAASVSLEATQGHAANGRMNLMAEASGVRISGTIEGLQPDSEHGFHVHENGDCSAPDASSAGGHFNPASQPHGHPTADAKHLGDMMNLSADADGVARVDAFIEGGELQTGQPADLLGKAIVVHAQPDDYESQPSGNSGDRIACGVIEAG